MISKVLSKETCKNCKFCCVFQKNSLWELPVFPKDKYEKIITENPEFFEITDEYGKLNLIDKYKTDDEIIACPFLDETQGCTLNDEDKPLECKIWPLRVMKKEDELVLVFETICPELGCEPPKELITLIEEEIGDEIKKYAEKYPFIAKQYNGNFPILAELK